MSSVEVLFRPVRLGDFTNSHGAADALSFQAAGRRAVETERRVRPPDGVDTLNDATDPVRAEQKDN